MILPLLSGLRGLFYRTGILRSVELPACTVSIGNLSYGGTGKSPFTSLLAGKALANGVKTLLLSRGYGRASSDTVRVPAGAEVPGADAIGDEPRMILWRNPGLELLVSGDRVRKAREFWDRFPETRLVLLDDAFQHWQGVRDLDIVLLDAREPPALFARRREGLRALARADVFVINHTDTGNFVDAWEAKLKEIPRERAPWQRGKGMPERMVLRCRYVFRDFFDPRVNAGVAISRAYLLSGIANPDSFVSLVRAAGVEILARRDLPDHAVLTEKLRGDLLDFFERHPGARLVVTEKDWARWKEKLEALPVAVCRVEQSFSPADEEKFRKLVEWMVECSTSSGRS